MCESENHAVVGVLGGLGEIINSSELSNMANIFALEIIRSIVEERAAFATLDDDTPSTDHFERFSALGAPPQLPLSIQFSLAREECEADPICGAACLAEIWTVDVQNDALSKARSSRIEQINQSVICLRARKED